MQIIPHSKQEWLRFVAFPFKAYVIIAPILFFIVASLPRPRHTAPDAAVLLLVLLFPDALILLLAALLFAVFGPKGHAFSCLGFALAAAILAAMLLPALATA